MTEIRKFKVTNGVFWIEVPGADLRVLCGCPADVVKHLKRLGLLATTEKMGVEYEMGPNAILLSDILVQNGSFSNLAEFPILQMMYNQGKAIPNHPNNTGEKPMLLGSKEQIASQLQYIYRGNYGLISKEEILQTGTDEKTAEELMQIKLKFAFGRIKSADEFIDTRIVNGDPVEIKNGVYVYRLRPNIFEFHYKDKFISVDLNLKNKETYSQPYVLGYHHIEREYFSVIHSGEGDGWDINRPSMASILQYQGKIYLIDAGPNIEKILMALGISINEVEGIFHSHAHDDHFAGLPALLMADHKLKYFATPLVRHSVLKKLSALISFEPKDFYNYFEVYDLKFNEWNNIDGLEVKPLYSPHPVETNIYYFRAQCAGGYKTYAHLSDIVSFEVFDKMNTGNDPVIEKYSKLIRENYLQTVDLKKIDAGGGLIHGNASNFNVDKTPKIVMSHTSSAYSSIQKEIGSNAHFGMVDKLIHSYINYPRRNAQSYIESYFPQVPKYQIKTLLNNPVDLFNPGSIILKKNEVNKDIYLVLTGNVEIIQADSGVNNILSAGAVLGELSGLTSEKSSITYRAKSFVEALRIPAHLYLDVVTKNDFMSDIKDRSEKMHFVLQNWLLGEAISYPVQNKLAIDLTEKKLAKNEKITYDAKNPMICFLKEGKIDRIVDNNLFEVIKVGDFFGEENVLLGKNDRFKLKVSEDSVIYQIPGKLLLNIPIIRWKLFESYNKRLRYLVNPDINFLPAIRWDKRYSVGIDEEDALHKKLFEKANNVYFAIYNKNDKNAIEKSMDELIAYAQEHFAIEEKEMKEVAYPNLDRHKSLHDKLIKEIKYYKEQYLSGSFEFSMDFVDFLKGWIINHILDEDKKYSQFLRKRN